MKTSPRFMLSGSLFVFAFAIFFHYGHFSPVSGSSLSGIFSIVSLADEDIGGDDFFDSGTDIGGDDTLGGETDIGGDDMGVEDLGGDEESTVEVFASFHTKKDTGKCEMTITKSVSKTTAAPGDLVEYTIEFKNIGQKNCTGGGVKVVDVIDSRLAYASESHSSNVTGGYGSDPVYKPSDKTLRWNAATLTPGESGWVKWKATIGVPNTCSETIPNKAKITSYEYDNFKTWAESNEVNVVVEKDCTPPPQKKCEMIIEKSVDKTTVAPGDLVEYTIEFENIGQKNCTGGGVKVVDVVDARLEYVSENHSSNVTGGYGSDSVYTASDHTLRWNADTLVPGESGWVKWKAKVGTPNACTEQIPNDAKITSLEYDYFETWVLSNVVSVSVAKDCTPPPTPKPICTLSAVPTIVEENGTTTLAWTSAYALSGTIDHAIGDLSPIESGTTTVSVATTTTYVATFSGQGGITACETTVTVTPPPTPEIPACTMTISPATIALGAETTLSWTSANVSDLTIDQGIGVASTTGQVTIKPSANTTYVGIFSGSHGEISCQAAITVTTGGGGCTSNCGGGGGGGGQPEPTVVLYQTPSSNPLALVYLSQVPYTGFPATPFTTTLFWVTLIVGSLGIGYLVVYRGFSIPLFSRSKHKEKKDAAEHAAIGRVEDVVHREFDRVSEVPHNLPIAPLPKAQENSNTETVLEPRTVADGIVDRVLSSERILVSKSGMQRLASLGTDEEVASLLAKIVYAAKRNYPREDGWILLSDERIDEVLSAVAPHAQKWNKVYPQNTTTSATAFLSALLDADKENLYAMLRSFSVKGNSVDELFTDVLVLLDRAYRVRIEGGVFSHDQIGSKIAVLSTKQLESLVQALSGAIDQAYSTSLTGAKLAIANATSLVSKWKEEAKQESVRSPFVEVNM